MALKLDNTLLEELGLGTLPDGEKQLFLKHIYEKLEMNVGVRLADQMSNEQLDEFEKFVEANDDQGAFKWLEGNFPNYKQVVNDEFEKLKAEIASIAPQVLASSAQNIPQQHANQYLQPQRPEHPVAPQQVYQQPYPAAAPAGYGPQPGVSGMAGPQYQPTQPQPSYSAAPAGPQQPAYSNGSNGGGYAGVQPGYQPQPYAPAAGPQPQYYTQQPAQSPYNMAAQVPPVQPTYYPPSNPQPLSNPNSQQPPQAPQISPREDSASSPSQPPAGPHQ